MNIKEHLVLIDKLKGVFQHEKDVGLEADTESFLDFLKGKIALSSTRLDAKVDEKQFTDHQQFMQYLQQAQMGCVDAYWMIQDRIDAGNRKLDVNFIQDLHACMLSGVSPECAGVFRNSPARWLNSTMIVSNYRKIAPMISNLVDGYNKGIVPAFYLDEKPNYTYQSFVSHPVIQAIQLNYDLVAIHPFADGNKRIARMLSNFTLQSNGYAPLDISRRESYIQGIENYFNTRDPDKFYETMFYEIEQSHRDAIQDIKKFPKNHPKPIAVAQFSNEIRRRLNHSILSRHIHERT